MKAPHGAGCGLAPCGAPSGEGTERRGACRQPGLKEALRGNPSLSLARSKKGINRDKLSGTLSYRVKDLAAFGPERMIGKDFDAARSRLRARREHWRCMAHNTAADDPFAVATQEDEEEKSVEITSSMVRELREKTNAGMMDCKKALQETGGDMEKAVDLLRKKGLAVAMKRAGREVTEGAVHAYIHAGGKIGVLVEVNCETDFAARSEDFQTFIKDLAMHIAAMNPLGIQREDVPQDVVDRERAIFVEQAKESGKPANIVEKMVEGKMRKFYEENVLMEQAFVKDPDKTIADYLNELVAKTGERIVIRRFVRYQLGA
ncbi:translation elongation factor Ts [Desulfosoma caldarium]|uniref:Elongation factor Ts n=1 Tax=Desulfosoma caldarium TaxID=610254 RepID=A0A3N1UR20_9BACT|nr:translation elongation factor Ts [Desulfosoma caldarium]